MKRHRLFFVLFGMAALVLTGCSEKNMPTYPDQTQVMKMPVAQVDVSNKPIQKVKISEYPVINNKGTDGGKLIIFNDKIALYVTFRMAQGWLLDAANLIIVANMKQIPVDQEGQPDIGKFPLIKNFRFGVSEYMFILPYSQYNIKPGQRLIVAAFSDMHKNVSPFTISMHADPWRVEGWAGDRYMAGPAAWAYLDYMVKPEFIASLTPQTSTLLQSGKAHADF